MKRLMEFKFNENQLIGYLRDFIKWFDGEKVNKEENSYIAEYVMLEIGKTSEGEK